MWRSITPYLTSLDVPFLEGGIHESLPFGLPDCYSDGR